MKKLLVGNISYVLLVCLFLTLTGWTKHATGQMVYLPDTNFKNKLLTLGYSSCIVGDSINSSCALVANTTKLDLSYGNIRDLQGILAFTNLDTLKCYNNYRLTSIPSLPSGLIYLDCMSDSLVSIAPLPSALKFLRCTDNKLTSLPALPNSLEKLDNGFNMISNMPSLPGSLINWRCTFNQMTSLPVLPNTLEELYCDYNYLTSLPALPNSLDWFVCGYNQLTSLPALPGSLGGLFCYNNYLTSLPALPNNLYDLNCSHNNITSLPPIPAGFRNLDCSSNNLTSLPPIITLNFLNCSWNQISSLPDLRSIGFLQNMDCSHNQLTSLPALPDNLSFLYCNDNPNLSCLPVLTNITTFHFSNTAISCLPNYGTITNSTPLLSSIPLCGIFNPNSCDYFWNISGKSYFDNNIDCAYDSGDINQKNMKLLLYQGGNLIQQAISGGEGHYSFDVSSNGMYQVKMDTTDVPFDVLCPAGNVLNENITAVDSLHYDRNFSLKCKTGFDLGVQSIYGSGFIPAHLSTIDIHAGDLANFYGVVCATGVSGNVTVVLNGPVQFINPAPGALVPSLISGDTLTYNVADFGAVNWSTAFDLVVQTDTTATMGNPICFAVSVSLLAGDNNALNNTLTNCFEVRTSFDPNDKAVSPSGDLDTASHIEWLTYTIRFQNTGNAEADNILLLDTLSPHLNLSTFQLVAYSHQPVVQIFQNGVTKFNFPNIHLPDSNSNEPASHGYVQYKIKLKDSLPLNTQIQNTAYIYFDFNSPVVTNTTLNTIVNCAGSMVNQSADICPGHIYFFDGQFLNQPGTYYDTLSNAAGCDSVVVLTLQVHNPSSAFNQTICSNESYFFNGTYHSQAGIYSDTLSSYLGCDSIVTLDLRVDPVSDSAISEAICIGFSYNFNGWQLSQAGNYSDTLQNWLGCDSIVTLQLAVNQPDTSVLLNGNSLSAISAGASYAWIDCFTGIAVPAETGQSFYPSLSGNYALEITENNCTDTSACYYLSVTGIREQDYTVAFAIHPNPARSHFFVDARQHGGSPLPIQLIELVDITGQLIYSLQPESGNQDLKLDLTGLAAGMYFVKIVTENGYRILKLAKE